MRKTDRQTDERTDGQSFGIYSIFEGINLIEISYNLMRASDLYRAFWKFWSQISIGRSKGKIANRDCRVWLFWQIRMSVFDFWFKKWSEVVPNDVLSTPSVPNLITTESIQLLRNFT